MHPRRAIRGLIKDRLLSGDTLAQDRVFATMTPKFNIEAVLSDEGPVIMAYVRGESIKPEDYPASGFNGGVRRTLDVAIEALVVGEDADDKADDMAEKIEALFEAWIIPGFPSAEMRLTETQIDVTDGLERTLGGVFMTYEVKYWTAFRPDTDEEWVGGGAPFLPTDVYGVARGEHGDPPGVASPLISPAVQTVEEAKANGWQPGDLLVDGGGD